MRSKADYQANPNTIKGYTLSTLEERITVLFLPQLTENFQFQWVIKDQDTSVEAEAALSHISGHPVRPCVS